MIKDNNHKLKNGNTSHRRPCVLTLGVYLEKYSPEIGGSASLSATVLSDLIDKYKNNMCQFRMVVLFKGKLSEKGFVDENGIGYININRFKMKSVLNCYAVQTVYAIRNIKRRLWLRTPIKARASWLDMLAKKENIDLFWFVSPVLEHLQTPYIYTVWDLGHRDFPEFPEMRGDTYKWNLREMTYMEMLPRASYVLTGNEQGKRDIIENYPLPEKRLRIVPFMISSFCNKKEKKPSYELPCDYFVYPAQFWAHKNHIRIVQAVDILKNEYGIKANILFTGRDYINKNYLIDEVKKRGLEDNILFLGFVPDEELHWIYTHSLGMIYASLMGPNNLPPIEACYLECPVILSDLVGHREEIGDAALYFDGYDAKSLAECMKRLYSPSERKELIKRGKAVSERFNNCGYSTPIIKIVDEFSKKLECWKGVSNSGKDQVG